MFKWIELMFGSSIEKGDQLKSVVIELKKLNRRLVRQRMK